MANEEYELYQQGTADALADWHLDHFAFNDGYYAQLTAGAADNLTGRGDATAAEFLYRTAGGTADIETGQAVAKSIKGNTLVWNQLLSTWTGTANGVAFSGSDGKETASGTPSTTGNTRAVSAEVTVGHKYLVKASGATYGSNNTAVIHCYHDYLYINGGIVDTSSWAAGDRIGIGLSYTSGETVSLSFYPQLFDLTQMFGAENEPSTVAEFEALFPEPYYEYDAGSLLSVNMEGIETVGFNQYPLAEMPLFAGGEVPAFDKSQCFVALGNNQYRVQIDDVSNATSWRFGIVTYEMDETPTSGSTVDIVFSQISYSIYKKSFGYMGNNNGTTKAFTFTTNRNIYVRLYVVSGDTIRTSRGINPCVHLVWSGRRNGEYEPFWSSQRLIDVATYFPDGMRSAGTVYDELTSTEAITRVGVVDLGTLTWGYDSGATYPRFYAAMTDHAYPAHNAVANAACAAYDTISQDDGYSSAKSKGFCINSNGIWLWDTAYTDATAFKTAMSGVMLYYALATPTVTPIDPALNLSYRVDDFGTERVMVPEDERSAPPVLSIAYGLNVVDFVRRAPSEYISAASFRQYLLARDAHDGTTTTMTWDDTDNRYEFAITDTVTEG